MGKYLHYFETENDYNSARTNNYVEPWVSTTHLQSSYRVNYNKSEDEKLLETALTFEILGNGNITWNLYSDDETAETGFTIEYKKNDGEWTTIAAHLAEWIDDETYPEGGYYTGGTEISVNNGDIVQFRGDNPTYYTWDDVAGIESYAWFNSTCQFKAKANIMSLIDSTDFVGITALQSAYTFIGLFVGCAGLIDAGDLLLPATTLAESCYQSMFRGCTSLTTVPELPATTLADGCYSMMFDGCTSLTTVPELPATTLADGCYREMFWDCTGLTTAPELPATTLANNCYAGMFWDCTGLTTAPVLPATTLAVYCYSNMFNGCTSLTTAPELPATTLTNECYNQMFRGCTNLNYIKCLATNISANYCTSYWVSGVANSGTFVKNPNMSSWTSGFNGIPTNWTVQDA